MPRRAVKGQKAIRSVAKRSTAKRKPVGAVSPKSKQEEDPYGIGADIRLRVMQDAITEDARSL